METSLFHGQDIKPQFHSAIRGAERCFVLMQYCMDEWNAATCWGGRSAGMLRSSHP